MAEPLPNVLIIIPCLDEEEHLEQLVLGLLGLGEKLPTKIVIVDGGSDDQTVTIAENLAAKIPNVFFLHNPKRIQAAGVNLAVAEHGNGVEFFIRIDAHAGYPKNYCEVLIEEAQKTQAAAVVVAMHTVGRGWFQESVAAAQNSKLGNGGSAHRNITYAGMWVDHGHHALMRIDAFRKVGGYDESFSHNEDAELDVCLQKAGLKIWLTGKTSMTYYPRSSPTDLFIQYFYYGYGRARTILKHYAKPKIRQLLPALVAPAVILALLTAAIHVAVIPLEIWMIVCISYGIGLAIISKHINVAAAGPVAMIMHLGWSLGFWKAIFENLRDRL